MAVSFKAANTVGSCAQRRSSIPAARVSTSKVVRSAIVPFKQATSSKATVSSRRAQNIIAQAATMDRAAVTASDRASIVNQKPVAVITGASSGLGLAAATALAKSGDWHVIMACRDFSKAEMKAKQNGLPADSYTVMHLDLASLTSVRQFVAAFKAAGYRLDSLVANAAVYLPTAEEPTFTPDGFELSVGTNHLGHFLLCNMLLEDLQKAPNGKPKMVIVGSITGNTNTLAGNVPPKADLGDLSGLASGASMIDGKEFNGAKAYKDSKVCNMLTMREMHKRFHESTGVTFASLYPGCIATTGLFRSHVPLFKTLFPLFQQYVTKGFVSEEEAGKRLARVVSDPSLSQSGAYWSFKTETSEPFMNQVSEEVADDAKAAKLWDVSCKLVGLA